MRARAGSEGQGWVKLEEVMGPSAAPHVLGRTPLGMDASRVAASEVSFMPHLAED